MNRRIVFSVIAGIIFASAACTAQNDKQTFFKGQITIADSIDNSRNYSGISITVFEDDSLQTGIDTLFSAVTNARGNFQGVFEYENPGRYPVLIGRNGVDLGLVEILFADGDTVDITAQLPDVANSYKIKSREANALRTYDRVRGAFERVVSFVNSGQVPADQIPIEFEKFSELFWSIYEDNKGTLAASLSASESLRIMSLLEADTLLNSRIDANLDDDEIIELAVQYGTPSQARENGLEGVISYLDKLKEATDAFDIELVIDQKRVKVLYDSLEIEQAEEAFAYFERRYTRSPRSKTFIQFFGRELDNLAPGLPIPTFEFVSVAGDTFTTANSNGNPRLYEITDLSDPFFQSEFERIKGIALVYQIYSLEVLSIPINESQVAIDAFYYERGQTGPVLDRTSYRVPELIDKFNLTILPTWILVDGEGKIIRKYVREEISDITNGLSKAIN